MQNLMSWWEFLFQIALWQQLKIPSSEYFRQADKPGINVSIIVQQEVFATLYFLKFETEKYSCCLLILFFIVLLRSIKDNIILSYETDRDFDMIFSLFFQNIQKDKNKMHSWKIEMVAVPTLITSLSDLHISDHSFSCL